jgi:hypothetical protein
MKKKEVMKKYDIGDTFILGDLTKENASCRLVRIDAVGRKYYTISEIMVRSRTRLKSNPHTEPTWFRWTNKLPFHEVHAMIKDASFVKSNQLLGLFIDAARQDPEKAKELSQGV